MKNTAHLLAIFMLFIAPLANAQPGDERSKKEKIEDLKIAFITKELMLTSDEAQKFWPVYNELSEKIKSEKKTQRSLTKDMRANSDNYSETDFKRKSASLMDSQIREATLKKTYHEKIAGIIGYKKAVKLIRVEQRFKRELLNRLNKGQQRNNDRRQGGRGGR